MSYCWEIEKFSHLNKEPAHSVISPTFYAGSQDKFHTQWQLELFPGGIGPKYNEYVGLYLTLLHSNFTVVETKFEIWLLTNKGGSLPKKGGSSKFHLLLEINQHRHGWHNMASQATVKRDLLHEDKLTVHCNVDIIRMSGISIENMVLYPSKSKSQNKFWKLYNNKQLTDLTVRVEGKEFQVHKAILAAQSSVFAAMLEHDMTEKVNSCVTICDYDANIVAKFIEFMYTESCEGLYANAQELLSIAEKYDVEYLKTECEIVLAQGLTEGTAAKILLLADLHNASLLKTATLDYIEAQDTLKIMGSVAWQSVLARPSLADYIVKKLVHSLKNQK